jgi:hypothetical protein
MNAVRSVGDEQGASQEPLLHGAQLDAPLPLALFERIESEPPDEPVTVVLPLVDPGLGNVAELDGVVTLGDVREAGAPQ